MSAKRWPRSAAGALLLALVASAGPLAAQEKGPADAEKLFEQGKALLEQGKVAEACDKLAWSDRIEPSVGSLGLLAACHEKQGLIAKAWAEYKEVAQRASAGGDARGKYALERAAALEPDLPRLKVTISAPVPGIEVLRAGMRIPDADIGAEAIVDPGEIEIVARAPGRRPWSSRVKIAPGEHRAVEIPALLPEEAPQPDGAPQPETTSGGGVSGRVILAIAAGGVGLAGIGVMTGFGLSASSKNSDSDAELEACRTSPDACARGRGLREDAQSAATIATVGFAVGVAGVAAATVILLTGGGEPEPPAKSAWIRVTPDAGPGNAGLLLRGAF